MMHRSTPILCAAVLASVGSMAMAQTFLAVERDDVAYGLNRNAAAETLQLIRGTPIGLKQTNEWGAGSLQSVQFDNVDGFRHATRGNLLAVTFGAAASGGTIVSMQTQAGTNPGAFTRIFDVASYNTANPSGTLSPSRLAGVSISPDNTKLAVTGFDSFAVYVFDYAAGDGSGTGNVLTNARVFPGIATGTFTSGTAWLDNNTLLATDNGVAGGTSNFVLKKINVGTGSVDVIATLPQPGNASYFSSVAYEPTISPNVYVLSSGLNAGLTSNKLHVIDPNTGSVLATRDYSTSMNTGREIGFNSRGDLIISQFGNTSSTPLGGSVEIIANAWDVSSLADNVSSKYYIQDQSAALSAQFSGVDVAMDHIDYVTPGVTVNMRTRDHTQAYFGSSPLGQLRSRLQTGYAGGAWTGAGGILSTNAAASSILDGIGYGESTIVVPALGGTGTFRIRYTLLGDATLDGSVNISDFSLLGANFNQTGFWGQGDFNYDGTINIGDFSLLAANFNQTIPGDTLGRGLVPEPMSLSILAAGAIASLRRRR